MSPLRRTPGLLAPLVPLVALLVPLVGLIACASGLPPAPSEPPGDESHVILVLPFNVATEMPPELESGSPIVWQELERYLREQGKQLKTVSWRAARTLWLRSVLQVRGAENGGRAGYDEAARALARELRGHTEFDAMVAPSLFLREARISRRSAHWDGVERELEIEARGFAARTVAATPLEGVAPAASLHVAVFDADGVKLHESSGGLELLVRVRVAARTTSEEPQFNVDVRNDPTFLFDTRTDLFANRQHVREGIDQAFVPFLRTRAE